jgi:hypothetical protein
MKAQTKWILGGVVVAGLAYYLWTKKSPALGAQPQGQALPPSGQPASSPGVPSILPTGGLPGLPGGLPAGLIPTGGIGIPGAPGSLSTPVTLTTSFQAADVNTGMLRTFNPGEQVIVYGAPVGGYTVFVDTAVQPNMYATQSVVAGQFTGARGGGGGRSVARSSAYGSSAYGAPAHLGQGQTRMTEYLGDRSMAPRAGAGSAPMFDRGSSREASAAEYRPSGWGQRADGGIFSVPGTGYR